MAIYNIFNNLPTNKHDMTYNIIPQLGYTLYKSSARDNLYIKYNQQIYLTNVTSRPRYNITTYNSSSHTLYLEPTVKNIFISPLVHNNQYVYNSPMITLIPLSEYNNINNNNIAIAPNYPIRRYIDA